MNKEIQDLFALRTWIEQVLQRENCEVTGTGVGLGCADVWFKMYGIEYFLSVKPVLKV